MATTYNNLYLDTRARLRKAGIDAAQLEARELLCYASDKSREQLYRDMSLYVSAELERRVEELVQRRLAGEPVAYIVGEWEFYGLPLDISSDVLIPRSDTEVLAERAILRARAAGEGGRVLDLCAGSGCVGLAVAANVPACRVVLGELSEGALRVCKQNVRRNSLNARVTCVSVNALEPPASALWDFDIIACNPPYIPTGDIPGLDASVRDYEPHMALDGGADGLDFYRAVTQKWKSPTPAAAHRPAQHILWTGAAGAALRHPGPDARRRPPGGGHGRRLPGRRRGGCPDVRPGWGISLLLCVGQP